MNIAYSVFYCKRYLNELDITTVSAFMKEIQRKLEDREKDPNIKEWIAKRLLELGPWPTWFRPYVDYQEMLDSGTMDDAVNNFIDNYNGRFS
jgi:hypothetical protein